MFMLMVKIHRKGEIMKLKKENSWSDVLVQVRENEI